jgi:hypothetical protein
LLFQQTKQEALNYGALSSTHQRSKFIGTELTFLGWRQLLQRPGTGDELTWDRSTQKSEASTNLKDKNPPNYISSPVIEVYIKFMFINDQEIHITVVPITFKHFLRK